MKIKPPLIPTLLLFLFALPCASAQAPQAPNPQLDQVLTQMDQASARFHSATADFKWDQYQKVVDETDTQSGKIYFRRENGKETQIAADVEKPDKKYLVYSDGKLRFYQPRINQITEREVASKNRGDVEGFLVLGFGGGGHELLKTYDITLAAPEPIDGKKTSKLELIPKSQRVRGMFNKIVIWVLPDQAVSLQQEFFEPSGDTRTTTYTNIQLNKHISEDVFKIKADPGTKTIKQ